MNNKNIQSEKECISGSSDVRTLLNPNIQAGVQESAFPQTYNRGIVRICATENPGKSTDPRRFSDMGNCGNEKIRCWLDTKSVDNALTASAIGMRNETLENLNDMSIAALKASGEILEEGVIEGNITYFAERIGNLGKSSEIKK